MQIFFRRVKLLCFFFFTISPFFICAQVGCAFDSNIENAQELCSYLQGVTNSFSSDSEAELALERILTAVGIPKSFALISCNDINNCIATTYKDVRYIIYDKKFMNEISRSNSWINISILAHEIGHHIKGHTKDLAYDISPDEITTLKQQRLKELEADEFSGYAMFKLGATLNQAQAAIQIAANDLDDTYSTHPNKTKRLAAISKGYYRDAFKIDYSLNDPVINLNTISSSERYDISFKGVYRGEKFTGFTFSIQSEVKNQKVKERYDGVYKKHYNYYNNGQLKIHRLYYEGSEELEKKGLNKYLSLGYYKEQIFSNDTMIETTYFENGAIKQKTKYSKTSYYKDKDFPPSNVSLYYNKDGEDIEYYESGNIKRIQNWMEGDYYGWQSWWLEFIYDGFNLNWRESNQYYVMGIYDGETSVYNYKSSINKEKNENKKNDFFKINNLNENLAKSICDKSFNLQNAFSDSQKEEESKKHQSIFNYYINQLLYTNSDDEKIFFSTLCIEHLGTDITYQINDSELKYFSLYNQLYDIRAEAKQRLGIYSCDDFKRVCESGNQWWDDSWSEESCNCVYHTECK